MILFICSEKIDRESEKKIISQKAGKEYVASDSRDSFGRIGDGFGIPNEVSNYIYG